MDNNLKQLREQCGFSLQELADMYGGSKANYWALENGKSSPTLTTAYSIACVFDVSVYEIWPDNTKIVEETKVVRKVVNSDES